MAASDSDYDVRFVYLRQKEVMTIMMSLFDDEQIMRIYAKDIEKETKRRLRD